MREYKALNQENRVVWIPSGSVLLEGELSIPEIATGLVLFAYGSGSSRHSPRNQYVARIIREAGVGTLLFDLLTQGEEAMDAATRHFRFDISLLARRLMQTTAWIRKQEDTRHLRVGYFGTSTGAAAAFVAAADIEDIGAIVSRGGRPDFAGAALLRIKSPSLLIVGERDEAVVRLNEDSYAHLRCEKEMRIVRGANHLFEEPGTLETVARHAAEWFRKHLQPR
jgi:putative phosphoribosyl transferase